VTPAMDLRVEFQSIAEALLIGLLVGIQREGVQRKEAVRHAGVRDFPLIALSGAICALLQLPWLTAAALIAIAVFLTGFALEVRDPERGVTTELAAIVTFFLGFLTAYAPFEHGATLAIATTVMMVALLEAKKNLHKLIREGITEIEFSDTLRFLALIFIIYPILPEGNFGPYGFLTPRKVWLFVILVSSISYAGYFLQKYLGAGRGIPLMGILGGLASTTAATLSFARATHEDSTYLRSYWQATVLANAVQFPRVLLLLYAMNPVLAQASATILAAMTVAGLVFAYLLRETGATPAPEEHEVAVGNPFRLLPALKFGAMFAVIVFFSKAASAKFGAQALILTSVIGGSIDVDAVSVSVAELFETGSVTLEHGLSAVLTALFSNAVLKTVLAATAGSLRFALRVAAGFAVMFAAGGLTLFLLR
jgi:uncharacterized membrane protein (DUF4010 family)